MDARGESHVPFDERGALEELDRLRAEIEQQAARRRAAEEEFDAFVRSFKKVPDERAATPATELVRRRDTPVEPATTFHEPASTAARTSRTPAIAGGALILLTAGGLAVWTLRNRAPEPASTTLAPTPAAPAPEAKPAAARLPPPGAELTTTRRVWVRVIVDGERALEREMPEGSRVPLTARQSIVIRTGDAGAVRLSVAGRDLGFLGREGEVVTRRFDIPPSQPR